METPSLTDLSASASLPELLAAADGLPPATFVPGLTFPMELDLSAAIATPDMRAIGSTAPPPASFPAGSTREEEKEGKSYVGKLKKVRSSATRRQQHNQMERRRQRRINAYIAELKALMEASGHAVKKEKAAVLGSAVEHVRKLQHALSELESERDALAAALEEAEQRAAAGVDSESGGSCASCGAVGDDTAVAFPAAPSSAVDFRRAFFQCGIAQALAGLDGGFISCNPAFCALLGYSEEEMKSQSFFKLTHPEQLSDTFQVISSLMGRARVVSPDPGLEAVVKEDDDEIGQLRKRCLRADGEYVDVLAYVSIVRSEDGLPLHFHCAVVQDPSPGCSDAAVCDVLG